MSLPFDTKEKLDPKNDVVFQKIFGSPENEDLLINFLNSIFEGAGKEKVRHIEYVDTKLANIEATDDKVGILDIRVVTEKGVQINIEIQLINRYNMFRRTLFYWSKLYSGQIKRGQNYKDLNKTVTINILNFNYIDCKKCHTSYHLYEDSEKIMMTDILEVHFVELPKYFDDTDINKNLSKWLAFLINPQKESMEVGMMEDPAIKKAINVLDMLSRDPETVRLAELRMKNILDEKSMIEGAKEEGMAEGKIQGAQEVAKNALIMGAEVSFVSAITGLREEEVTKIKNEIKNL